jgi:hypothetical protein
MGEAEGSHTKAHHLGGWSQENRSGAESAMGEVQSKESSLDGKFRSRGKSFRRALFARGKPETLSDHAVANSWWDPSSLPSWLNEEYYVTKIQPRLRTFKVREISEAMHVSKPYAALVRAGRRRPHPRHWEALAGIVGVSVPVIPVR